MKTIELFEMYHMMHPEEGEDEQGTFWDDLVWVDRHTPIVPRGELW